MQKFVFTLLIVSLFAISMQAQSMPAKPGATEAKKSHRLPNNYGKLDLSDEQRQKIYNIQDAYDDKLNALLAELEDLRNQEVLEIQSVLTTEQKNELLKLLEASQKRREAKQ